MRLAVAVALGVIVATAACSDGGTSVTKEPLPSGVVMHIDQSRVERKGREVFLRVHNDSARPITVTAFTLRSPRFTTVRWKGDEEIGPTYETDLEFDLPTGRCGTAIDARVVLTYRIGDGDLRESTADADDPYGSAALFADRDCAQTTLEKAADVEVGDPRVVGTGLDSVLELPVTFSPTGRGADVRFGGFESTVLFRQTESSPTDVDVAFGAGEPTATQIMSVVPSRCDPHALAEDKVGTLFGVRVKAPALDAEAAYFLPLSKPQRSAFFAFFRSHCGV